MELVPEVLAGLRAAGAGDVPVIVGGIIPEADAARCGGRAWPRSSRPKDFGLNDIMGQFVTIIRSARGLDKVAAPAAEARNRTMIRRVASRFASPDRATMALLSATAW